MTAKTNTPGVHQTIVDTKQLTQLKIREGIPKHLFLADTARSTQYLIRDLAQAFAAYFIMSYFLSPFVDNFAANNGFVGIVVKFAAWMAFWFVQGLNWTALWVLAHESGHFAFASSRMLNEIVGFVLHSFLLVPYHSWRVSHGNHHKHTNHLDQDTVFIPEKRGPGTSKPNPLAESFNESPIASVQGILTMLTLGWPMYLTVNATGQNFNRWTSHYDPTSPLFRKHDYPGVVMSDIGIVTMLSILFYWATVVATPWTVLIWYVVPYLWVNFWLVFVTYLQHTDLRLPHYTAETWDFVRGAVAAVDRDYGIINDWIHHINDSHIVHHLFSSMPHYHAIEVTRKYLPSILDVEKGAGIYLTDNRPMLVQLWESWRNCRYVVPAEGIAWFHQ